METYWRVNRHIQIKSGNTTAIAYVNNMGKIVIEKCYGLSKQILDLCISEISGYQLFKFLENKMSRSLNKNIEWQLSLSFFKKILREFDFEPETDLFAHFLNYQAENYASWFPDPKASIIDPFSIDKSNKKLYSFPLFSLIGAL